MHTHTHTYTYNKLQYIAQYNIYLFFKKLLHKNAFKNFTRIRFVLIHKFLYYTDR